MKTLIAICFLSTMASSLSAQDEASSKLRVGAYLNGGISSFVQGMGMNMSMYSYPGVNSNTMMYNYAGSWGGGLSFLVPLNQRWSFVGNVGYANRGANYGTMNSSYNAQYRLSYMDVWVMGQYNNIPKRGPVKFLAVLGLTQSTLLTAQDNSAGSTTDMMGAMNRIDVGLVLGPGLEFGLQKGAVQLRLLYTYGFIDIFNGMYYASGMHTNNAAFQLQVGYIFK